MLGKLAATLASAVIVATLVFWAAIELDRRNAPIIEITAPRNGEPIVVEIAGAVVAPGVYELPARSRVGDLIEAGGGLRETADLSGINQAALLVDGQRVTIPAEVAPRNSTSSSASASPAGTDVIDINRATVADFDALPGIGEVKANAIVDYRNLNGPFTSIDDLLLVEGISRGLLDDLRPYLTVST